MGAQCGAACGVTTFLQRLLAQQSRPSSSNSEHARAAHAQGLCFMPSDCQGQVVVCSQAASGQGRVVVHYMLPLVLSRAKFDQMCLDLLPGA